MAPQNALQLEKSLIGCQLARLLAAVACPLPEAVQTFLWTLACMQLSPAGDQQVNISPIGDCYVYLCLTQSDQQHWRIRNIA